MLFALASFAMLFASLFLAYGALRIRAGVWPPEEAPQLPILLPALDTFVLLASSVVFHLGLSQHNEERPRALFRTLLATFALGTLFVSLQIAVWKPLWRAGFTAASDIWGSLFYALTALHALHVVGGLFALAALLPGAWRGVHRSALSSRARATAMYWDFMAGTGLLVLVVVYLL